MISRTHRFHGLGSLKFVYKTGKTVRGPALAVKYIRNERRSSYRCAVVVSKKVSKSAVVRNRIRRRIFESVRTSAADFTAPYDMVITVYHEQIAEMPAAELAETLKSLFVQANLT